MIGSSQLPLDFDHRPSFRGEDFLVAPPNAEAVGWLDRWPDWVAPVIIVFGPEGCGKTHLGSVFMEKSGAREVTLSDLKMKSSIGIVEAAPALVLDGLEAFLSAGLEEALFHLYNSAQEADCRILMTAGAAPAHLAIPLADLRSRLVAAPAVGISAPDDTTMEQVLVKLFADRQLRIDAAVVPYMLARMERSFSAAKKLVGAIDKAALAQRRNVTVPFVRQVMESGGMQTKA